MNLDNLARDLWGENANRKLQGATVFVPSLISLDPILDGGGGQISPPPPAGFLNIAQKPLGLGS